MSIINLFKIALRAIASNKLRSLLTMLGIIIGVASVITMLAIGQGSKASIRTQIAEMGSNMIMIQPGQDKGPGGARQDASDMQTLKLTDYETLREQAKYLSAISPSVNASGQFINGNNNTPSTLYGISPDYLTIRQLKIEDGEMLPKTTSRPTQKSALWVKPWLTICFLTAKVLSEKLSALIRSRYELWEYWNQKDITPSVWIRTTWYWHPIPA